MLIRIAVCCSTSSSSAAEVTSYSVGSRGDLGIVIRF